MFDEELDRTFFLRLFQNNYHLVIYQNEYNQRALCWCENVAKTLGILSGIRVRAIQKHRKKLYGKMTRVRLCFTSGEVYGPKRCPWQTARKTEQVRVTSDCATLLKY
jgi:hypothetical protein